MNPETVLSKKSLTQSDVQVSIVLAIILTIFTCGIYILFWNARQMKILNALLEENRFSFFMWITFTILTCGIFHIYYEYKMAEGLIEIQRKFDEPINENLSLISLFVSVMGIPIAADAIHQHELNKLVERK